MTTAPPTAPPHSALDDLPGDLMIWVLIISELLVFGAGLAAFLAVRLSDPLGFAAAQSHLHAALAGVNTLVLVTSGWLAALAQRAASDGQTLRTRVCLVAAAALGMGFLAIKASEFSALTALNISTETHAFFTFYFLLTGFHAAHVVAAIALFAFAIARPNPTTLQPISAFWHMVDLVWVLLFPVIYLL